MTTTVNYSGLVIAGIGFFLTRFTVTLAIYEAPLSFYLAGVVPLAFGLGLAAFGVALAVADVEVALVRTTALWCVVGTGAMFVLAVLTVLGSTTPDAVDLETVRSHTYLSNFLIGGSVGGTLTGLYASNTHRQRVELKQQANRLAVLNRLLRHEVLNAVTAIRGYATFDTGAHSEARTVIENRSKDIERTIEEVKYLTRTTGTGEISSAPIDLGESLTRSVEEVTEKHPDVDISVGSYPAGLTVRANERLTHVFSQLFENRVARASEVDGRIEVSVEASTRSVRVTVTDRAGGLSESQRALLEAGDIEDFDDPGTGFGLNIVRLLVESYGGSIETDVGADGTAITIALPRERAEGTRLVQSRSGLAGVRPAIPHMVVTFVAALIAGVFYGIASESLGGSVAGIGVFYGTANAAIGWFTHEFHSVVFGFVFVSLVSLVPKRYQNFVSTYVIVGIAWALVLWVVAAGIVAPIWLRLLGIDAGIPSFSFTLLVSHLVWGISLGALTAWGFRYAAPWVTRIEGRLRRSGRRSRQRRRRRS